MLSRWVVCLFLVLLLVGEVDEFCHSSLGQRLRCHRPGAVVGPEQCPLNLTGCPNAHGDVKDSSALTIDTSGDNLCQCASNNSSERLCGGCSPSSNAVNALSNICSKTLPLGSVCGNLYNNQITNKRKRQREISDALQYLKGLLEAYSCVTREISDSDHLCCYISCCEVVPRIKQCLNVLNTTALRSIGEDVALIAVQNALRGTGERGMEDMNFLQWIGRGVGATFDCVHH